MKRGGARSNNVAGAATALLIAALGCLAISAQCARALDLVGGNGDGDEAIAAATPVKQPYCYRSCSRYAACTYCCASEYTPTICWKTQAKCRQECRLPWSAGPAPPQARAGAEETN